MKKLTLLLILLLSLSLLSGCAVSPMELAGTIGATKPDSVSYRVPVYVSQNKPSDGIAKWDTASISDYNLISTGRSSGIALSTGAYVVKGEVSFSGMKCSGDVTLILLDGSKLVLTGKNKNAGLLVPEGSSLTVYAQSTDASHMGTLIATAGKGGAGIGGGKSGKMGTVTINGGNITATGTEGGAGIGGGKDGIGSDIIINDGVITATGSGGAGIGGGLHQLGQNIIVNGGSITATAGENAAGIGGGSQGNGEDITITGGTVIATGNHNGAGIGAGGYDRLSKAGGCSKNITILGGNLTVSGGECAAAIGQSVNASGKNTFVASSLTILAGAAKAPTAPVCLTRTDRTDLSSDSTFLQQFVTIQPAT